MNVVLKSVSCLDNASYGVTLGDEHGEVRTFVLRVTEADGIRVVTWEDEFATYLDQNLAHASSLFEAILALDRAKEFARCAGDPQG